MSRYDGTERKVVLVQPWKSSILSSYIVNLTNKDTQPPVLGTIPSDPDPDETLASHGWRQLGATCG